MGVRAGHGVGRGEAMMYHVFGGDTYYPTGGADDWLAAFATADEAMAFARGFVTGDPTGRWAHVARWEGARWAILTVPPTAP